MPQQLRTNHPEKSGVWAGPLNWTALDVTRSSAEFQESGKTQAGHGQRGSSPGRMSIGKGTLVPWLGCSLCSPGYSWDVTSELLWLPRPHCSSPQQSPARPRLLLSGCVRHGGLAVLLASFGIFLLGLAATSHAESQRSFLSLPYSRWARSADGDAMGLRPAGWVPPGGAGVSGSAETPRCLFLSVPLQLT